MEDIFYNCKFTAPGVEEGDYIRFSSTPDSNSAKGRVVDVASIQKSDNPPARPDNPSPYKGKGRSSGGGGGGGARNPEVQSRISYQAARKDALTLVEILLDNEGLPVIGTSGKAAKAKRYEEILEFVDKLTVRFYNDTDTLRVTESVDDPGELEVEAEADPAEKLDAEEEAREAEVAAEEGEFDDDPEFS